MNHRPSDLDLFAPCDSPAHGVTRREVIVTTSLAACFACSRRRATGFPGSALITLAGENSLAFVDLNTFHLSHKLDLGSPPSAVSADQERAYVLTPATGTVHLVDPDRYQTIGAVHLGARIDLLRLTPTRGRIVGASQGHRELVIADVLTRKLLRRVKLEASPIDIDIPLHPKSGRIRAAISEGSSGVVELVDLETGSQRKCQLAAQLGSIRFRDDGRILFVANYSDRTLVVLDGETLQTISELSLPLRPENLCFTADQGQLFVSGSGMDGIAIVFVFDTIEVDQTVLAGRAPGAMACSASPKYLFVASRTGSEISILNIDSRKTIALAQAGERPSRIVITPDQQYALILDEGSGDMSAIRIPSIRGNRLRSPGIATASSSGGASLFAMIPVGQAPSDIAIFQQRR